MPISRYIITDRQWAKIEPHCLGKKSDPGRTDGDARLFLEGVFWIARTGAQWRDLPCELASGTRSTAGSAIGASRGPLSVFSMPCSKTRHGNGDD